MNCWICGYRLDSSSCRMRSNATGGYGGSASAYDAYHADLRGIQLYEIARAREPRDIIS